MRVTYRKGDTLLLKAENGYEKKEKAWIPGMTSVTFREKTPGEIIALTKKAGLLGIEWGGDIHVPPGDTVTAREVGRMTREEGISVLSYGSYYHLGRGEPAESVLETALELGAPNVRLWAGDFSPEAADETYWRKAVSDLREFCRKAEAMGLSVSTEYHRGTLTETGRGALHLMKEAGCRNLFTYWQPNPDITHEENLRELSQVSPYLSSIHVFRWKGANVRHPLEDGAGEWAEYIRSSSKAPWGACILEFVKDDSPEQFLQDARCLLKLLQGRKTWQE